MLVLIADEDVDYCAEVGQRLQEASHHVVLVAQLDACEAFLGRTAPDAAILGVGVAEQLPREMLSSLNEQAIVALLDGSPSVLPERHPVLAGTPVFSKPVDSRGVVHWLDSHRATG